LASKLVALNGKNETFLEKKTASIAENIAFPSPQEIKIYVEHRDSTKNARLQTFHHEVSENTEVRGRRGGKLGLEGSGNGGGLRKF
jgi:hypothetical protein